ncbi:hypothetical protein HY469_00540 [Candidatus Roizmanbacteria bacterium]|nr:hypothetical protein [Candidatus Roizmanbacteria bacterium]
MSVHVPEFRKTRCDRCLFGTIPTKEQYDGLIAFFSGMAAITPQSPIEDIHTIEEQTQELAERILPLIINQFPPEKVIYCNHPEAQGPDGTRIYPQDTWCQIIKQDQTYGFEPK